MSRFRIFIISAVLLLGAAVKGFSGEVTIADFDGGADPDNLGGTTFSFANANAVGDKGYDSIIYHGSSGYSWRFIWISTGGVDQYCGGGMNFGGDPNLTFDASAYNCISFWIFTPNANTKVELQLKDDVLNNGTERAAKAKLSDCLTTGTSVWQQVIIPFDFFKRNLPALNTAKLRNLVLNIAADSLEADPSGKVYIDDVKFLSLPKSPANSKIYSGGDIWTANNEDAPGDSLYIFDQAVSSATTNAVSVKVSTGYALGWASVPAEKGTIAGTTVYFAVQLRNDGNFSDVIAFSTQVIQGSTWPVTVFWDKDRNGAYGAGDSASWISNEVSPSGTYYFLVGAYVPSGAVVGSSMTFRLTAKDQHGTAAEDNWPAAGNDTIYTDIVAVASNSVTGTYITLVRSTDTSGLAPNDQGRPGDQIRYTVTYNNAGTDAGTNLIITESIPKGTSLTADPTNGSADSREFYVGSAWQAGYSANATKVRWLDSNVPAGSGPLAVSFVVQIKNTGVPVARTIDDVDGTNLGDSIGGGPSGEIGFAGSCTFPNNVFHGLGSGYSARLTWYGVDLSTGWAGLWVSNMNVNVSTYNALSFWIYTPNANTSINVQMQDTTNTSPNNLAKVQLQKYLVTGTSVWQNVVIPFDDFTRATPTLNLANIGEVKLIAENSMGNSATGDIYLDDFKFLVARDMPANYPLTSLPADNTAVYDQAGSTTSFNQLEIKVSTVYAVAITSTPVDQTTTGSTTLYFPYWVCNNGNIGQAFTITAATTTGQSMSSAVYWDKDKNGTLSAGDVQSNLTRGMEPGTTDYFYVAVTVPGSVQQTQFKVVAAGGSASATSYFLVDVSTYYAVGWPHTPASATKNLAPDTTAYFEFTVRNDGNVTDTFTLSITTISGNAWTMWTASDTNKNGAQDAGETNPVTGANLVLTPGASVYFMVGVYIPLGGTGSSAVKVNAHSAGGNSDSYQTVTAMSNVDTTPPVITQLAYPAAVIGMLGEKVLFKAQVTDAESSVSTVTFHYSLDGGAWVTASWTGSAVASTNTFSSDLKDVISNGCTVQYFWTAFNIWNYLQSTSTGSFKVITKTVASNITSGKITVDDGNPDDGNTSLDIPAGALGSAVTVTIEQQDKGSVQPSNSPADSTVPSTVFDFSSTSGAETKFLKPVTLTLLYTDLDKNGFEDTTGKNESKMRIFWWDGFEWRLIGGRVDNSKKTVTAQVMHLSRYAVFPIKALTADDYRAKERIITPFNADGKNDFAQFGVSGDVKINIYDVQGAKVRVLEKGVNTWDGKDDNGDLVESGVYIYQIKNPGETVSGTILVVK